MSQWQKHSPIIVTQQISNLPNGSTIQHAENLVNHLDDSSSALIWPNSDLNRRRRIVIVVLKSFEKCFWTLISSLVSYGDRGLAVNHMQSSVLAMPPRS